LGGIPPFFYIVIAKMFEYPERRKYNLKLELGQDIIFLKFKQATAEETIDYFETCKLGYDNIKEYRLNFIKNYSDVKIYHSINPIRNRRIKATITSHFQEVITILQEHYHKQRKSVYE